MPVYARDITVVYVDRFGRQQALPVQRAGRIPFEELPPLRPPVAYPGRTSFVTNAAAPVGGQALVCSSLRELACSMLLDRDPQPGVRSAGPMELHWQGERPHRVRPAFVAWRAGRREVVCVQPSEITEQWSLEQHVLATAAAAAGWLVRVMVPPQGLELDNLTLMHAARDAVDCPEQLELLLDRVPRPRRISRAVRAAGLPLLSGVDLAYHLLWKGALLFDPGHLLTPATTVWRAAGPGVPA
ncbi:hypothetical protein ELQ87_39070 [Streptomyces griseoviridis]|uniref:TnsA-like heteromeric transposase endonuclease subunit n=2 Tax=Streptomyces griseoviridis TaxID=45398 RepID=A0A3Q9KZE2_STRGD|nr:hypothetical protein [Streptomyces griseoviridis]AZS89584.1 hypothetical protein ELQ87_39070 [Streptomyces griseoviridis]